MAKMTLDELIDKLTAFRDDIRNQEKEKGLEPFVLYPYAHLMLVNTENGDHYPVDLLVRDVIPDVSPEDGSGIHPILLVYEAGEVNMDLIKDKKLRVAG